MNDLGPLVETFAEIHPWHVANENEPDVNFLGVSTDPKFVERHHPSNTEQDGSAERPEARLPIVSDGEPFFEFAAIYKAVRAAKDRFVMVELGGGYAARAVDANRLLQILNPMPSQLVIVEAEPTHFDWAKRHLEANGINPAEHWLINAAVSVDSDPVLFMSGAGVYYNGIVKPEDVDEVINQIIERKASEVVLRNIMGAGSCGMSIPYDSSIGQDIFDYKFVSAMPLADILAPLPQVDLIDMDIQGAEDTAILPAMDMLNRRVKRLHIGTHNPNVHRGLWELFFENEWICEFDYAPFSDHETPWGGFKTMDGILHLNNSRFA